MKATSLVLMSLGIAVSTASTGKWDNSVAVNNPGQSGDWTSPYYRDLFPLWHSGPYFPLLYSRPAIEQATTQKITLVP
jgi:penicillin G amidase